jgi:hypothetical protein
VLLGGPSATTFTIDLKGYFVATFTTLGIELRAATGRIANHYRSLLSHGLRSGAWQP